MKSRILPTVLTLVAVACGHLSQAVAPEPIDRHLGDSDWSLEALPDSPRIGSVVNGTLLELTYRFTGELTEMRHFVVGLWQDDCLTSSEDNSTLTAVTSAMDHHLLVDVHVDSHNIASSTYWTSINVTLAVLSFCLRVDYDYGEESVNFHETKVHLWIDLAEDFAITAAMANHTQLVEEMENVS